MSRRRCRIVAAPRVALAAAAVLLAACGGFGSTARSTDGTTPQRDGVDAGSRLDLANATLEQISSGEIALAISTHGPWDPADVKPLATRSLCVWLRNELSRTPQGRLCVVPDPGAKSGVRLRYTTIDHLGRRTAIRELSADTRRPDAMTVTARIQPSWLHLVPGRYLWQVRSRSRRVDDRLPDTGERALAITLSTAPAASERCFAAASRDPEQPCSNPELRRAVVPTPYDAVLSTNSPCSPLPDDGRLRPCGFGVPAVDAKETVALVGDSHAGQWRGALEYAAQHKRWNGVSITRSGCPLSRVTPGLTPASRRKSCLLWNAQLPRWFRRHPEIHTLFVSQHTASVVKVRHGVSPFETRVAGYRAAWTALPPSVRRIVVLRDTPLLGFQNLCVESARARKRDATACGLPRAHALRPDPAAVAAQRLRSRRVRVIDMTPFFCDPDQCLPVVGGALVFKDSEHMTDVFSASLGPYVLRAIDAL